MAKTYRTAKGKTVDLGSILNQNETVRAVGNMNVNARGDLVDSQNKTIERKNKQVQKQYRKQIGNTVTDDVVYSSKRAAQAAQIAQEYVAKEPIMSDPVPPKPAKVEQTLETVNVAPPAPVVDPAIEAIEEPQAKGGLAAAIAKARQVKQEPLKSPRQQARDSSGVKKI
jgi:ElaB/YqjD/DUF883 family membrane-anchored ribosome-binding protein